MADYRNQSSPTDSAEEARIYDAEEPQQGSIDALAAVSDEVLRCLKERPEDLFRLSPRRFEELVAHILASFGWEVHLTSQTRDGGYDIFCISRDMSEIRTSWITLVQNRLLSREHIAGLDGAPKEERPPYT